jgi:hypothetical protein
MHKKFLICVEVYANEFVSPAQFDTEKEAREYLAENPLSTRDAVLFRDITKKGSKSWLGLLFLAALRDFYSAVRLGSFSVIRKQPRGQLNTSRKS